MANSATRQAIEEDLRADGGEDRGDPVSPGARTTNNRQEVQEKDPLDRVKSFC